MPTNYFWLFVLMIANLSDIVIFYLLSYKFFDKRPPFLKQHIAGAVAYGLGIGMLSYYIGEGYLFQFIIMMIPALMIIYLHQKTYQLRFFEVMVLYALSFLILVFTRMPLFILSFPLNLNQSAQFLLVTVFHMFFILGLIKKKWLTRLYERVARDIFLQIAMAIVAGVFTGVWLFSTFKASATYVALVIMLLSATVISLYQLIPMIYFHTKDLPRLLHDRNTELMAHHARIHTETECLKAKKSVNTFMEKADMNPKANDYLTGKYQKNIGVFIDKKIEYHNTAMKFEKHINYAAPHQTVEYDDLLYMIGILTDNAIESGRRSFPAFITLSCIHSHLLIEQSNAILSSVTDEKVRKMLHIGASTKAKYGRGYGLYNLNEMVKHYGGELEITSVYDAEYESDYIVFRITISAYKK